MSRQRRQYAGKDASLQMDKIELVDSGGSEVPKVKTVLKTAM